MVPERLSEGLTMVVTFPCLHPIPGSVHGSTPFQVVEETKDAGKPRYSMKERIAESCGSQGTPICELQNLLPIPWYT
jgi:hypothetical protein